MPDQQHAQTKRVLIHRPDGTTEEVLDTVDTVLAEEATGNTYATQTLAVHETLDGRLVHGVPGQQLPRCIRCKHQFSVEATVACTDCARILCRRHAQVTTNGPICQYCRLRRWWRWVWTLS